MSAAVSGASQFREPLSVMFHDEWNTGHRFDVVDDGGASEQTHNRRKRRLEPGKASFSLKRFQKRGLLAADIGARAAMNHEIQMKSASKNIFTQIFFRIGFVHGGLKMLIGLDIFSTDINIGFMRPDREGADHNPLDHRMRVQL